MNNFRIPEPYRAWCHGCAQGFMSVDEITEHNHTIHTTGIPGMRAKPKKVEDGKK